MLERDHLSNASLQQLPRSSRWSRREKVAGEKVREEKRKGRGGEGWREDERG